jgi:hypothetical protein
MNETTPSPLTNVINDERIKNHLERVVRGSVGETLNALRYLCRPALLVVDEM